MPGHGRLAFESGVAVRGNRGRGAKDLAAFGDVTFASIKDDRYAALKLESNGQWSVTKKPLPATAELRQHLGIPRHAGGTVVTVHVRDSIRCPRMQNLREKTQTHFQLRDIMRDHSREVLLINAGRPQETFRLQYDIDSAAREEVLATEFEIPGNEGATARLTLWRLPDGNRERPASDPGRPQGVLIVAERALYENSLFLFESNPYAHRFSGRLE
jgi:hypothetical protein